MEMAMAYWNIVLKGRFRFLDVWNRFLKVRDRINLSVCARLELIYKVVASLDLRLGNLTY